MQKDSLNLVITPTHSYVYIMQFLNVVIIHWQDYIANLSTIDMAYNVLIDHALAERDRRYAFSFHIPMLFFWLFSLFHVRKG